MIEREEDINGITKFSKSTEFYSNGSRRTPGGGGSALSGGKKRSHAATAHFSSP
jgi:hypothetical protein